MRLYAFFLVTSLSFLILSHASAYLFNFYCYCHFLSTTKPSMFSPFIWTLFSPLYHICSLDLLWSDWEWHLRTNAGFPVLWSTACPQHRAQPQSTVPEAKTPGVEEIWAFFFFHWCKSQLESENKNPLTSPKAHVWYFIVSGYGSKVSFTICLHVTHWKWLADGNSIILQTCILRSWHPSWLTRHISKFLISTTVTSVSFVENYYNLRTGVANLVL